MLPDPMTFLSEEDLRAYAESHAEQVGLVVEEVNYVPFLGGTAEFVLRPKDEIKFMPTSTRTCTPSSATFRHRIRGRCC